MLFWRLGRCSRGASPAPGGLLVGSLLYLVGTVLVTMARNVPLNNALAAVQPESADVSIRWERYAAAWTAWNHVRTAAALLAAAAFIVALYCHPAGGAV